MSFLSINKTLRLNNFKTRTTINAKISVFLIYVEPIICLLLYNLHDCNFKEKNCLWKKFSVTCYYHSVLHKYCSFWNKFLWIMSVFCMFSLKSVAFFENLFRKKFSWAVLWSAKQNSATINLILLKFLICCIIL